MLALLPTATQAADKPAPITGIFSDLYYNKEGGDLLGTEVFIVPDGDQGYIAFVQAAQGTISKPVVVSVHVNSGRRISFIVPAPSDAEGSYMLQANDNGVDGTRTYHRANASTANEAIHLKRKPSYWEASGYR